MVLFSSCSTVLLMSGSTTGGRHSTILHVYTQRLRASVVLQYTREHLHADGNHTVSERTEADTEAVKTSSQPRFPGLLHLQNLAFFHGFLLESPLVRVF